MPIESDVGAETDGMAGICGGWVTIFLSLSFGLGVVLNPDWSTTLRLIVKTLHYN